MKVTLLGQADTGVGAGLTAGGGTGTWGTWGPLVRGDSVCLGGELWTTLGGNGDGAAPDRGEDIGELDNLLGIGVIGDLGLLEGDLGVAACSLMLGW